MKRDIVIAVLLAAVTLLVYWPMAGAGFSVVDDPIYLTQNVQVKEGFTAAGLGWAFTTTTASNWHPLTWLSLMLDYRLFHSETSPNRLAAGSHMTNVALHVANAVLLFFVLKRLTKSTWPSAAVAALFALHPQHVESVAWVAERKDVLSALFWILTMGAYALYVERPSPRRYAAVCVGLALGLMTKPMLVTLPLVLLLLDVWPLGRMKLNADCRLKNAEFKPLGRLIFEKVPLFVLVAAAAVVTYIVQLQTGAMTFAEHVGLAERLANAPVACGTYIIKTFWPDPLVVFYPYNFNLPLWQVAMAVAGLAAVTALVVWQLRRRPYLAVGWFWFLGTLVPVIGLVQVGAQAMADRYTYVPLTGVFIMIAWGAADLFGARPSRAVAGPASAGGGRPWRAWVLGPAAGVALAACAVLTAMQLPYWTDALKLYEHDLAVVGNNATVQCILGNIYLDRHNPEEAARCYREALALDPAGVAAHFSLGRALEEMYQRDEAMKEYGRVLELDPAFESAHVNMGMVLLGQGRVEDAVAHFNEALRICPDSVPAHNDMGLALTLQGKSQEAIRHFRAALAGDPGLMPARKNLGELLVGEHQYAEALAVLQEGLRRQSNWAAGMIRVARLLATCPEGALRNGARAVALAEAVRNAPTRMEAMITFDTRAAAYAEVGRFDLAVEAAGQAVQMAQTNELSDYLPMLQDHLKLFQNRQPLRE
jgi:tetratricopeptide (TPR) repeat protein